MIPTTTNDMNLTIHQRTQLAHLKSLVLRVRVEQQRRQRRQADETSKDDRKEKVDTNETKKQKQVNDRKDFGVQSVVRDSDDDSDDDCTNASDNNSDYNHDQVEEDVDYHFSNSNDSHNNHQQTEDELSSDQYSASHRNELLMQLRLIREIRLRLESAVAMSEEEIGIQQQTKNTVSSSIAAYATSLSPSQATPSATPTMASLSQYSNDKNNSMPPPQQLVHSVVSNRTTENTTNNLIVKNRLIRKVLVDHIDDMLRLQSLSEAVHSNYTLSSYDQYVRIIKQRQCKEDSVINTAKESVLTHIQLMADEKQSISSSLSKTMSKQPEQKQQQQKQQQQELLQQQNQRQQKQQLHRQQQQYILALKAAAEAAARTKESPDTSKGGSDCIGTTAIAALKSAPTLKEPPATAATIPQIRQQQQIHQQQKILRQKMTERLRQQELLKQQAFRQQELQKQQASHAKHMEQQLLLAHQNQMIHNMVHRQQLRQQWHRNYSAAAKKRLNLKDSSSSMDDTALTAEAANTAAAHPINTKLTMTVATASKVAATASGTNVSSNSSARATTTGSLVPTTTSASLSATTKSKPLTCNDDERYQRYLRGENVLRGGERTMKRSAGEVPVVNIQNVPKKMYQHQDQQKGQQDVKNHPDMK